MSTNNKKIVTFVLPHPDYAALKDLARTRGESVNRRIIQIILEELYPPHGVRSRPPPGTNPAPIT